MPRKPPAKKGANHPQIVGFEAFPQGKLLNQKVEFDGPVGIAYERCIGYTKPPHTHDRITITFPRGGSRSFIRVLPENKTFKLNEGLVHVMAENHRHEQGSYSSVYDTFAIFVTAEHFRAQLKALGAKPADIESFLRATQAFRRGAVLDELVERYFFCRILEEEPSAADVAYLQRMILAEVFSLGRRAAVSARKPPDLSRFDTRDDTGLVRALEYIEGHLFEKLQVSGIVKESRTSQASLFRVFRRELKASPLEYVRNRRLDEARSLLRTGDYQVGDVALLVGYEELSSFSKAFKTRFRETPSDCLPER